MLVRIFACGAVLTAALILSAPLAHAGGHGGGHGGGGHGGGSHAGAGFHSGGFHSSSFHSASAWHGGGAWHGSSFHNRFHSGFHNGFHTAHFHNGNRVFVSIGLGGWGWGWGGWGWGGWGWGWPWWWNSGSWGDSPSYYTYAPTYVFSVPGATMPYDDAPSSDGTYPYDGGPRVPVPMPHPDTAPKGDKAVERDGTKVAPIAARPKYMYPAYGEGVMKVAKTKTPASTDKQTAKKSGGN